MPPMKLLLNILACFVLLLTACSYRPFIKKKDKVLFARVYRDYSLTSYGADSVKLAKPLQILLGVYFIEYELSSSHLIIRKRDLGDTVAKTVLLTQTLSKADSRLVSHRLANIHPAELARRAQDNQHDDGLQLNITLTKADSITTFNWDGRNESDLTELLNIVNNLSTEKYKLK